ncbi:transglutaminase domain-containing protein [candidate division WOR-3 bacterium]|nr:transglutaminase domain-containing protein [candidate division WOR-3 bacterium]
MKKIRIWLPVLFLLIGIGVIFFIKVGIAKPREVFSENFFEEGSNTEYLGVYLKGHKVGYLASRIDTVDNGYRVFSNTYLKLSPLPGIEKEVSYRVTANTDGLYNLKNFEFSMFSDDYFFEAKGERSNGKLLVDMNIAGQKRKQEYEIKSSFMPATIEGLVKTGKTGKFEFFDPTLQSVFEISVRNLGDDTLEGEPVTKYGVTQSGMEMVFWVSDKGKLIRSESPIGLVMKREGRILKEDIKPVGLKLYDSYAIKVAKEIENPRGISMLKIRLDSVDLTGLRIEDDRQTLNGNILTIRKIEPGESTRIPEDIKEFLKSTPFIPSDDEKVKKIAEDVVGDKEGIEAVENIISYVDKKLTDKPTFSIPNALDALESGEGDCNEHSALAVALLRAIGIPSRVEVGLVYVESAFYYHAWIGVYLGGKWISADPTFNQLIADPTHVKLEYGGFENQAKLYRVINKLQISVLDYD